MKQSQHITQKLGLSQRHVQTMNMLAMTATELGAYLDEVALENPVIEVVRPAVEVGVFGGARSGAGALGIDEELVDAETPDKEDFLLSQVNTERLSCEELSALRYLIGMIDENGFLPQSAEQAARGVGIDRPTFVDMLKLLHSLEPHGIGARTVQESLLLQLRALSHDAWLAESIVRDHVALLAKNRVFELERAFPDATREEVVEALRLIRGLDPRPGSMFVVERTQYVLADVIVEETEAGFEIGLGPAGGYDVRLDGAYRSTVREGADRGAEAWVEAKYRQAYGLRASLKQRRELMLTITECVVRRQKAFFSLGPRYLEGLTMSQVAKDLELSVSTVSRAVKGSYVQCRWGVLPFRALFSQSAIERPAASGDPRMMLRDIVAGEQRSRPLSDQKIVEEFARCGVDLSRRTVARYRQELGIPPASERRYR